MERRQARALRKPYPYLDALKLGVLGWTFEALAVAINPGSMREAIKKTINGLEDHGMFASDRKRRPGSDVRVLRLNPKMAGRAELEKLLRRAVVVWPEFEDLTRTHLGMMGSKTLAHLERRGLIGEGKKRPKPKPPKNLAELRAKCIREYNVFSAALGRPATSGDLFKRGESPPLLPHPSRVRRLHGLPRIPRIERRKTLANHVDRAPRSHDQ